MSSVDLPNTPSGSLDLAALRAPMLRFARSRLRNPELAEDAVSEAMLAALEKPQSFASAAQAVAWMYGVLRHKLVDQLRQQAREVPASDRLPDTDTNSEAWSGAGAWHGSTCPFDDPEAACSQHEFLGVVQRCCDLLPALQKQAFQLRELRGLEPEQICQELGITAGHLWVLVHRAKQRLQTLLQAQWPLPAQMSAGRRRPVRAAPSACIQRDLGNVECEAAPGSCTVVPDFDAHLAAWRRMLLGVVEQVGEDPLEQVERATSQRQAVVEPQFQAL